MKLIDKKAEKIIIFSLILSIPVCLTILYLENGKIGSTEIGSTIFALASGIIIYLVMKKHLNK